MSKIVKALPWLLTLWIAYVYLWFLQYKFFGHEGSVYLFTVLTDWLGFHGYEKAMRIGVGSTELLASLLLFIPATQVAGAALSLGIITGAIFFHVVSPLGIDPYEDGAVLFKDAVLTWFASAGILVLRRREAIALAGRLPVIGGWVERRLGTV